MKIIIKIQTYKYIFMLHNIFRGKLIQNLNEIIKINIYSKNLKKKKIFFKY